MRDLKKAFENRTIDYEKLAAYGFSKNGNDYSYEVNICEDHFKVIVELSKEKQSSKVLDLSMNEEYVLVDVHRSVGDFVGNVKEAYEKILHDIIEKCSEPNVFQSEQAKEVIAYVKAIYEDDLEYLWKKFPNNAVWRNKENKKWYGALLALSESKLGLASDRIIDILDLRYQKDKIKEIIDHKKVFEGYHMNKNNWITIRLDKSVDIKEIYCLIENSYQLSLHK